MAPPKQYLACNKEGNTENVFMLEKKHIKLSNVLIGLSRHTRFRVKRRIAKVPARNLKKKNLNLVASHTA